MPEPMVKGQELWSELRTVLDRELNRLPEKYRVAIVLCDLEDKTRKEAGRQLGVPEGTLSAADEGGNMFIWDAKTGANRQVQIKGANNDGQTSSVDRLQFTPDGLHIFGALDDRKEIFHLDLGLRRDRAFPED
jgi:hypothetical protein